MFHQQSFKNLFIFFCILAGFLAPALHASKTHPTKQEQWDAMAADVDRWIDPTGCTVDDEIKEIVIALNLSGIKTTASCEGHLDHGEPFPWVDIAIDMREAEKIEQEMSYNEEQIKNEEELLARKFPRLSELDRVNLPEAANLRKLFDKQWLMYDSIQKVLAKGLGPLNELLCQFYKHHRTSYDNMLIVPCNSLNPTPSMTLIRFYSIGGKRQCIRTPKEQRLNLAAYQEEMRAFANFLKKKFMSSKSQRE
jgi:hypothetical protein